MPSPRARSSQPLPRPSLLTVTGLFQSKVGRITRLDYCGAPKPRFLNSAGESSIVFYVSKATFIDCFRCSRLENLRAILRTGDSCIWNALILFNTQYHSSSQRRPVPSVPSVLAGTRRTSIRSMTSWRRQTASWRTALGSHHRRLRPIFRSESSKYCRSAGFRRILDCQSAFKTDPRLECAPRTGQDHAAVLTVCRAW